MKNPTGIPQATAFALSTLGITLPLSSGDHFQSASAAGCQKKRVKQLVLVLQRQYFGVNLEHTHENEREYSHSKPTSWNNDFSRVTEFARNCCYLRYMTRGASLQF